MRPRWPRRPPRRRAPFGGQEGEERRQQAQPDRQALLCRITPYPQDQVADGEADGNGSRGGFREFGGEQREAHVPAAGRCPDGDGVQHQRCPVVENALGAQDGRYAPRHPGQQPGHGPSIRERDDRAEDQRGRPRQAQHAGGACHAKRGGQGQSHACQRDDAQVGADLAQRGVVPGLPVHEGGTKKSSTTFGTCSAARSAGTKLSPLPMASNTKGGGRRRRRAAASPASTATPIRTITSSAVIAC